jgi:DNA-binding NarL/FixJ family response regulator
VSEGRTTNEPIKVLLADDHAMFRQGLAGVLASYGGMEVLAEVPNDAEALQLARDLAPDVVLMQVQMPFSRAVETLIAMRAFPDPPKVVIVTMFESPRYVRALTGVGASAYLLKSSSSDHLVAAVRAAVCDPGSESTVVGMPEGMLEGTREGAAGVLTARELEILLLAARGLSNERIASSLRLSEATVKRHLANVYQKMGVSSRGEASREALLRDWITIEEVIAEDEGASRSTAFLPYPEPSSRSAISAASSTAPSRSSMEASRSSVTLPSALKRASMPLE